MKLGNSHSDSAKLVPTSYDVIKNVVGCQTRSSREISPLHMYPGDMAISRHNTCDNKLRTLVIYEWNMTSRVGLRVEARARISIVSTCTSVTGGETVQCGSNHNRFEASYACLVIGSVTALGFYSYLKYTSRLFEHEEGSASMMRWLLFTHSCPRVGVRNNTAVA